MCHLNSTNIYFNLHYILVLQDINIFIILDLNSFHLYISLIFKHIYHLLIENLMDIQYMYFLQLLVYLKDNSSIYHFNDLKQYQLDNFNIYVFLNSNIHCLSIVNNDFYILQAYLLGTYINYYLYHNFVLMGMINNLYLQKLVNLLDKLSIYLIKHHNKKNYHMFNIYYVINSSVQEVHKIYIFLNLLKMVEPVDRYIILITSYNIFHQYNIFLYIFFRILNKLGHLSIQYIFTIKHYKLVDSMDKLNIKDQQQMVFLLDKFLQHFLNLKY